MGYDELPGTLPISISQLWAGWFPGRSYSDIPTGQGPDFSSVGSPDCNSVVWFDGKLRKLFGDAAVTSSALNGAVTSLFWSTVLGTVVGTAGTKIYSGMQNAAPADITGAVTITSGTLAKWVEWQFQTTKLAIGVNQANPPWKWTGAGNAAALGGSPPQGKWAAVHQSALWIGNTSTEPSTLYFSALGDPETWTTASDNYKLSSPITGIGVLADLLVVFKENSIAVLSGTNNRQLTLIDNFITGIGCPSGFTIRNGKLQGQDVIFFHSYAGWYAFNGTREVVRLSTSIMEKYIGSSSVVTRFNQNLFSGVCSTWWPEYQWVVSGTADSSDSANNLMIIKDTARLQSLPEGSYIPHWPSTTFPAKCLETYTASGNSVVLYGHNTDGKVYKLDPTVFTKSGATYTGYWVSNILDLGAYYLCNEVNVVSDPTGATTALNVYINMSLSSGSGNVGAAYMRLSGDLLDSTFIMDSSNLAGATFIYPNVDVSGYGRFLQVKFENTQSNAQMNVYRLNMIMSPIGLDSNVPS